MVQRFAAYWGEAVEPRIFLFTQLRNVPRGLTVGIALLNVLVGLLPVGFVVAISWVIGWAPKAVSGGLGSPEWNRLTTFFVVASGLFLLQQVLTPISMSLGNRIKHLVDGQFHQRLMRLSLKNAGIELLESRDSLKNLEQAAEDLVKGYLTPGDAAAGSLALITRYTRLIGFAVVLAVAFTWWASVVVVTLTMVLRYGQRGGMRMVTRLRPELAPFRREAEYFRTLGMGAGTAKELRIYQLTKWVRDRYEASSISALLPLWWARRRVSGVLFLWFAAGGLLIACGVSVLMLRTAIGENLSLTRLSLALQALIAAILLGEFYHEADTATQFGMSSARAMDNFEKQVNELAKREATTARAVTDAAGLPAREIRFDNVSFGYQGAHRAVFDGLNLTLRAGECTAIVGLNGAGKTTLVKLLARLYEPTGGKILLDGRDMQDFSPDAWRRRIAIVFQDFIRYELSVADNVAFGAVDYDAGPQSIRRATAAAGMDDVVERLPRGASTLLARHYDGGTELSGGQWQRIAIARALYAVEAGASVLVLDEPTAALDVRAEAAFFTEFAKQTRGLTTLLISHRFSSVRHADRIVVLSEGQVVEDGTHDALLAHGGMYARLFDLQARRFNADRTPADDDTKASDRTRSWPA